MSFYCRNGRTFVTGRPPSRSLVPPKAYPTRRLEPTYYLGSTSLQTCRRRSTHHPPCALGGLTERDRPHAKSQGDQPNLVLGRVGTVAKHSWEDWSRKKARAKNKAEPAATLARESLWQACNHRIPTV